LTSSAAAAWVWCTRPGSKSLGRLVALKFLPADFIRDPQWLERFRREARTASALNHPHICTIYDTGECDGRPFLSMELIEGQTLAALAGRPLPPTEAARLIGQAAKALAAAHAAGVLHRDIKPENLMLRGDGILKVVDFGLARQLPSDSPVGPVPPGATTDPGTRIGTVLYMSPEQARAEPLDTATDIFSLGVVLYELATGEHPFHANNVFDILHAVTECAPRSPRQLNPEIDLALESIIEHMLAKDPRVRPTAAEVVATLAEVTLGPAPATENVAIRADLRPLIGRAQPLECLRDSFAAAVAGRGSLLCVTGQPGLGKTMLVEQFLDDLTANGPACCIGRGRCSERLAGADAYLPVLEALDGLLHGKHGATAARLMRTVAPTWYAQVAPHSRNTFSEGPADDGQSFPRCG